MAWIALLFAGLLEIVWATGMKLSDGFTRLIPSLVTLVTMALSFWLLSVAMRTLPLGTAYTIWTGIGAVGSFLVGILVLGEPVNAMRLLAAVLIAAVLMVLCGCLRNVEEAYRTINWESIVLIAAMLPMSVALEKTGASEAISHGLVAGLGGFGPFALMAGVYFTASLLTMFISNTATAVLLAPIALQSAASMGISPYPLLLAVSVGTSMCFASPFSTPPNALVMPAGKYTFMDYVKVGVPLQVIMGLVMVVVIPLFFPFGKA